MRLSYFFIISLSLINNIFASQKQLMTGEILTEKYEVGKVPLFPGKCRIFLIRHAETEWNVLGKSQGWNDIPLNEKGKDQARKLAHYFADLPIRMIIASPLQRATETARLIFSFHPEAKFLQDASLRFYDPKKKLQENKTKEEIKEEIANEIKSSCRAYICSLSKEHLGENVILLTHGKVIKHLMQSMLPLERAEKTKCKVGNSQVLRVLCDGKTLELDSSCFVDHQVVDLGH